MRLRTAGRALLCAALTTGMVLSFAVPAQAATELVPFQMDASNQAGWWRPMDEYNGQIFMAYNAWGSATAGGTGDTHTVYVARRESNGTWTRGCMQASGGGCAVFNDDIGHNQPTIAIDGDGYIHAFVSMHNNDWRYYRSNAPGDVTSMVNRSSTMPDTGGQYTYPTATRMNNGDVYLIIRAYPEGRLYRWNNATNVWTRVATFARETNYVVYPDDVVGDANGHVHIAWEWAYGGTNGLRHLGSYMRYSPSANRFYNAAGTTMTTPVTTHGAVVYQPIESPETATGRDTAPGVQSAKLSIAPSTLRPVVAYRYRSVASGPFRVRLAEWNGSSWQRSVVYSGSYDTFAAIDVTTYGTSGIRVYYAKNQTVADDHAYAASRSSGTWTETSLLPGVPVERLSVTRRGGTDHLYLAVPTTHGLYYGTYSW